MNIVDKKVKEDLYNHYKALIHSYYHTLDIINSLEAKIINGSASKEETDMYYILMNKLNEDTAGKYEYYQVVTKDGTEVTKRKKVSSGIYEPIIKDYVLKSYCMTAALKKLSDAIGVKDTTLCCSEDEYDCYLNRKKELEKSIFEYSKELEEIKQHIRDYELINNVI